MAAVPYIRQTEGGWGVSEQERPFHFRCHGRALIVLPGLFVQFLFCLQGVDLPLFLSIKPRGAAGRHRVDSEQQRCTFFLFFFFYLFLLPLVWRLTTLQAPSLCRCRETFSVRPSEHATVPVDAAPVTSRFKVA